MKTNKKHILLLLTLIILISCKDQYAKKKWAESLYGKQSQEEVLLVKTSLDSLIKIEVKNSDLNKTIVFSEFISEYKYIPLETKEKGLIGLIDKIIVKDNRIYILDQLQAGSIFTFDWNGNLLNVINNKGKGPGEYVQLDDITVLDDGFILVYDSGKNKILKYDKEGDFISDKKVSFNFSYMLNGYDGELIFSTNYNSQNYHFPEVHCNNLLISDTSLVIKKKALPYSEKNLMLRVSNGPDFFESDRLKFYHPYLCDTIYQIEGQENIFARYVINFEGKTYSRKNLKDKDLRSTDDGFIFDNEEGKKSKYLLHPFSFSSRIDHFNFSNMGKGVYSIYYDKKMNKSYTGNRYDFNNIKNIFTFNPPQVGYRNYLIGYVNASIFVKGWENYKKSGLKGIPDELIARYDKVKTTDNPVMFFAKTK